MAIGAGAGGNGNGNTPGSRAGRLTRSISMSLLYDDDPAAAFDEAEQERERLAASAHAAEVKAQQDDELRQSLLSGIDELLDELKNVHKNIADQALEHIHADEVILTFGHSKTVECFLRAAARKRRFKVFVAQAAPAFNGHEMALALSSAGIDTTLIDDQAVCALMARVNKVVISAAAVLADGSVVAQSGVHLVALAAKAYNVPFVACTGLYKLSPTFEKPHVPLGSPAEVLRFGDFGAQLERVRVDNPVFDYVPPNLVTLLLTNFGGYNAAYVYRLLSEWYDVADKDL